MEHPAPRQLHHLEKIVALLALLAVLALTIGFAQAQTVSNKKSTAQASGAKNPRSKNLSLPNVMALCAK